jgi:hypothetical protein
MNQNSPSPRTFLIGALFAMTTTCIWSGWNVMSRMGVSESSLLPTDIVFLRYAVSGTLTLPFFIHFFRYYKTVPKHFLALMLFGSGFPYLWMACLGFSHAPASHGALIPGFMLLCVAVISALWLKEEISRLRKLGYGLIAATVLYRLITHSDGLEYLCRRLLGHLYGREQTHRHFTSGRTWLGFQRLSAALLPALFAVCWQPHRPASANRKPHADGLSGRDGRFYRLFLL